MTNFEWKYKSVGELAAALAAREISARELAEAAIARNGHIGDYERN